MNNNQFLHYEYACYWLASALYISGAVLFICLLFFQGKQFEKNALIATTMGLFPHSAAILLHWHVSQHGPYLTKFESLSSSVWIAIVFFLLISFKIPKLKALGAIVVPICFLLLGMGLMTNPDIQYLPAAFQTIWLIIHIFFNKLALGAILTALGCSIFYLVKDKRGNSGYLKKLPDLQKLDLYSYKFCGLCFMFWTITVIAGSIWAHKSWGRYWAWDPIETWSIITWLIFGLYMHLRRFHGLRDKKAAFFLIGCFVMVIATLFLVPFITKTVHTEYLM